MGGRSISAPKEAGVPQEVIVKTKPEIVLDQLAGHVSSRGSGGRCLLRKSHALVRADRRLRHLHSVEHVGVGAQHGIAAAEAIFRSWPAAEPASPRQKQQVCPSQGSRLQPALGRLAHGHMA
jgi:hypothetical protein